MFSHLHSGEPCVEGNAKMLVLLAGSVESGYNKEEDSSPKRRCCCCQYTCQGRTQALVQIPALGIPFYSIYSGGWTGYMSLVFRVTHIEPLHSLRMIKNMSKLRVDKDMDRMIICYWCGTCLSGDPVATLSIYITDSGFLKNINFCMHCTSMQSSIVSICFMTQRRGKILSCQVKLW